MWTFPFCKDYELASRETNFNLQPMRPLRLLLIYLAFVFLGAALLAPWIYLLAQQLANQSSTFAQLANLPFHRYVNRTLLLLAVAGLWQFLKALKIRNWNELGFASVKLHWKKSTPGFLIGFCSLAIVATLAISFGARAIDLKHSAASIIANTLGAALTAIVVAVLEEALFRGALFGALRKVYAWPMALIISSAVYAILHFFGKPEPTASINWSSGFVTLGGMFGGFTNLQTLVPGFINLLIVGLILGFVFQKSGNLYFSIGLHAGWIFWLKSYGLLTNKVPDFSSQFLGSGKMIDGWLATIVLLVVFVFLFARWNKIKNYSDAT
jgi:membrane protease YdiL (CAAX protease family)